MHYFANPSNFRRFTLPLLPYLWVIGAALLLWGLYLSLFSSPADYQQGETVRIMYIHVPSAYMGLLAYAVMGGASAVYLIWRHPLSDITAMAAALPGMVFTFICLVTGGLWGQPMWGTWWVWDARLTSVLILFFLYVGYFCFSYAFDDKQKARKPAAILATIGLVNLPIIKFSVDWWSSLHQPASLLRLDGPTISDEMLWPLLVMIGAIKILFIAMLLTRIHYLLYKEQIQARLIRQISEH